MKIAECSDSFLPIIDGVGTVVSSYAKVLSERGNEVYVITPTDNTGYRGNLPFEIVDFLSFPMPTLPWKLGLESIDPHFLERINMIDLDLVHVHSPGTSGIVGLKLSRKKDIPLIGSFHSKYYDDFLKVTHSRAVAKIGAKIIADFYGFCDEVWAVSENAAEALESYGYKGKIIVMPNGTNKRVLQPEKIPEVVKRYGIRTNVPVFLFVGQINWKKNLRRIIESCALLKEGGLDFQLVFAGRGPDEDAVKKLVSQCGLDDNFIMTGHLDDTAALDCLYAVSDLFLFPSIYDNAPMVLREAACMKTPAVVIEGSSTAEVVKNMENSFTCRDDNESMAAAIKLYLSLSDTEKEKIKQKAYDTIPVPWDGELMDAIENRYKNVSMKDRSVYKFISREDIYD